jgi:polyisoprenyl-phosphate glycosyltransferase
MPELSIIVPCLNDADRLPDLLPRLEEVCDAAALDVETIVIDDASEDTTLSIAQRLQGEYPRLRIRVLHRYTPARGYGTVARYGIAYAVGRFCALVAADLSDPIELLPEMLRRARAGAQVVQCTRYAREEDRRVIPRKRRAYQALYRAGVKLLLGQPWTDNTYAFKLFDRVYVTAMGLTSNRFSVSPEINFKVLLNGGTVDFVPGPEGERRSAHAKFVLRREAHGFAFVLLRASLHRLGILWF